MRAREQAAADGLREEIFGGPEQQPLTDGIIKRILAANAPSSAVPPKDASGRPEEPVQLELPFEAGGQPLYGAS